MSIMNIKFPGFASSTSQWVLILSVIICLTFPLCATACSDTPTSEASTAPLVVSSLVSFFPVQLEKYASEPYPSALATGEIVLTDGYLRLSSVPDPTSQPLIIWPAGFSVQVNNGKIQIINEAKNLVFNIGDNVKIGGGEVPAGIVEKYIGQAIPAGCEGPYWIASGIEAE